MAYTMLTPTSTGSRSRIGSQERFGRSSSTYAPRSPLRASDSWVEWGHPDGGRAEVGGMRTLSLLGLEGAERPRLNAASIRRLARLGTVVRWPGLLFAAILSLAVKPISPIGLALVLIWVASYNAWGMIAISRADDTSILRIGRALTLLDTLSYFLVLFVFGGVGARTSISAAYLLLIVWLVAYDGAEGAMLSGEILVEGRVVVHGQRKQVRDEGVERRD